MIIWYYLLFNIIVVAVTIHARREIIRAITTTAGSIKVIAVNLRSKLLMDNRRWRSSIVVVYVIIVVVGFAANCV